MPTALIATLAHTNAFPPVVTSPSGGLPVLLSMPRRSAFS
jgi:hypothetical protein